jgi:WD40 repeat protein
MESLSSVFFVTKPGHKGSVLSSCCFKEQSTGEKQPDIFFTNSEDGTIRMWDLRSKGAVKLFRDKTTASEEPEYSNVTCNSSKSQVYMCRMNSVQ